MSSLNATKIADMIAALLMDELDTSSTDLRIPASTLGAPDIASVELVVRCADGTEYAVSVTRHDPPPSDRNPNAAARNSRYQWRGNP